jgi:two-component system OmpR family response regulator
MGHILVIDDNNAILKVMDVMLTKHGYDVIVAHDGVEGIELFSNDSRIKLVITDIRMPGKDGNQVAKFIRSDEKIKNTPIIAMTAYPQDVKRELFDSILLKPFGYKELIELTDSLL